MRSILRNVGVAVLIGASPLLVTACSGTTTTDRPSTSVVATQVNGQQQPGGKDGQSTVRTIGKTGWYSGFEITVDKATVVPDEYGGGKIRIDITYRNTTTDSAQMGIGTYLQVGNEVDGGASFDNPMVPGKGAAVGSVTTSVQKLADAEHLLDTMTVVYGEASDNQTKIPLQAGAKVESVQPKTLTVGGKLVQNQTTIEVTGGTLAPSYTSDERGKMDLAFHIKIIGGSGIPDGGTNIYYDWFTLKTPDGQVVTADIRGPVNELLNRSETIDNAKNYVVFVISEPVSGNYTLSYDATKGESAASTLPITVN
ncbi:hypothetical protein JK358_09730 [Nocardia sp. 2]|uniref:DUF4352 domain-containing protein n=1 Tax=Nocardia acididurans TaxID=2802282 RepID=A0ABS1M2X2_9NOCA|nr:hypothetical protein [Nocardia acididurans]MBL1074676.1 hypothetical protein [Nocardia acididurans]